jgi:hypothetical protein
VGQIIVHGTLSTLSAPNVDLIGEGICSLQDGAAAKIQLHDVKNGAAIVLPGAGVTKGTTITCNAIGAGSTISLGSPVKTLTAVEWQGGALMAPWVGTINITGNKKQHLAGDCGADMNLTQTGAKGLALGSFTAGGAVTGTWTLAGGAGAVSMGSTDAGWVAGFGSDAAGWADVKSITTKTGDLSGQVTADSIGSVSVKGSLTHAALVLKRGPDAKLQALGALSAGAWIDVSRISSAGTIGSVTAGGMRNSTIFASVETTRDDQGIGGIGDSVLDLPQQPSDFTPVASLFASIAKLSLNGVKEHGVFVDSFINSNIAADSLGKLSLCYARFDNDGNPSAHDVPFGLAGAAVASLTYKDGNPTHKHTWTRVAGLPDWFDDFAFRPVHALPPSPAPPE